MTDALTPEMVLHGYTCGAFPMAAERDADTISWYTADPRTLLPLDDRFKVRRSLAKVVRSSRFVVTRDRAFEHVIAGCAEPRKGESQTWINPQIMAVYNQLAQMGFAHAVETWLETDGQMQLVGGLYGVALGSVFFGESMFSREPYASQVALVHLVEHLRARAFTLLDVQFSNPHLEQFGPEHLSADDFLARLDEAIHQPPRW